MIKLYGEIVAVGTIPYNGENITGCIVQLDKEDLMRFGLIYRKVSMEVEND